MSRESEIKDGVDAINEWRQGRAIESTVGVEIAEGLLPQVINRLVAQESPIARTFSGDRIRQKVRDEVLKYRANRLLKSTRLIVDGVRLGWSQARNSQSYSIAEAGRRVEADVGSMYAQMYVIREASPQAKQALDVAEAEYRSKLSEAAREMNLHRKDAEARMGGSEYMYAKALEGNSLLLTSDYIVASRAIESATDKLTWEAGEQITALRQDSNKLTDSMERWASEYARDIAGVRRQFGIQGVAQAAEMQPAPHRNNQQYSEVATRSSTHYEHSRSLPHPGASGPSLR